MNRRMIMMVVWMLGLSVANAVPLGKPDFHAINHPHDQVIHGWNAADLCGAALDRTGRRDVSQQLNTALAAIFSDGGGTLYLPAGKYRLDHPVSVPPGTGLCGDFVTPGEGPVDLSKNTVICAYYGRGLDAQSEPLIFLDGSSVLDGLVIWYPEQKSGEIVRYAPTIRHHERDSRWAVNTSTRNVFLVNAFIGVQIGRKNGGTCIQLVKNVFGTPLGSGVQVWRDADIPRILGIDFHPDYWRQSGLDRSVDQAAIDDHLIKHASGITYYRTDGSELANIAVRGYNRGLELANGHTINNGRTWLDNEGHYIGFTFTDCYDAVWIQNIKNHGTQFYNSTLQGRRAAVYMANPTHGAECAMFMGCTLEGGEAALMQEWEGEKNDLFSLMFSACVFKSPILWTGGNLLMTECAYEFDGTHIRFGPDVKTGLVVDGRFRGGRPKIDNQAGDRVKVGSSGGKRSILPPAYTCDEDAISSYRPPQTTTRWVEPGDGTSDDSQRIQRVIDGASAAGGGYVVLRPGFYVLRHPITVRAHVELRGMLQGWQHSKFISAYAAKGQAKGPVVYVEHGLDQVDDATITLEQGAGIDGLFFHYPGQSYNTETKAVEKTFGWLVRMQGDRSYMKHVCASNPWRFIDLFSHTPRDAYVGYCVGAPLDQGIRIGETERTVIDNVHFNSWYWNTVFFDNRPSEAHPEHRYKDQLDNWMKAHTDAFIFAGSREVDVYGTFIFCAEKAFVLLPGETSGKGPSGMIANSGNDWSKYGLYMHTNDGLTMVNSHFIDVAKYDDDPNISSIAIAEGCSDSIELFNVSTWGSSPRTFSIKGGKGSGCSIYNFSYQLYFDQDNIFEGGRTRVVNAIRNVPRRRMGITIAPDASFDLKASIFPTELSVNPPSAVVPDGAPDGFGGVRKAFSFPK